jgi:hypothetical protein
MNGCTEGHDCYWAKQGAVAESGEWALRIKNEYKAKPTKRKYRDGLQTLPPSPRLPIGKTLHLAVEGALYH